jgi:hypothetical protein
MRARIPENVHLRVTASLQIAGLVLTTMGAVASINVRGRFILTWAGRAAG